MSMEAWKKNWLAKFKPAAEVICAKYGVPPQVCVAQAALESGWGSRAAGFNYFGIKGKGTAGGQEWGTKEFKDGKYVKSTQTFAVYKSMEDGVEAYCKKVTTHPWFAPAAVLFAADPVRFVTWIWAMGYATAPDYAAMIVSVMNTIARATSDDAYKMAISKPVHSTLTKLKAAASGAPRRKAAARELDPKSTAQALLAQQQPVT